MKPEREIDRYARVYAWLIRLHPAPFRTRFGAEMQQLFRDRLRDRAAEGRPVLPHALWICAETAGELGRQRARNLMQRHGSLLRIAVATLLLLLVPAVAMQVTAEVDWTLFDFGLAGAAIFGLGATYDRVTRHRGGAIYRAAILLALLSGLLLFWINGAVGLIGSEKDDFNALHGLVLLVGLAGAAVARLRPGGMARTMVAMAAAHAGVGGAALAVGKHGGSGREALEILGVTGMFVALFLAAAWLFRQAGRGRTPAGT